MPACPSGAAPPAGCWPRPLTHGSSLPCALPPRPCRSHLSGNRLRGELPDTWAAPGAFPRLQLLALSSAHLNSSLPASWGRSGAWPSLKELLLDRNQLQGGLPPAWGSAGAFPALERL